MADDNYGRLRGKVYLNSYNLFYFDNEEKLFRARQMFLCALKAFPK